MKINITIQASGKLLLVLLFSNIIFSCTTAYQAPTFEVGTTQSSPRIRNVGMQSDGTYLVNSGETLYSIAFQFDLDYSALASANGISSSYTIYPGQILSLNVSDSRVVSSRPSAAASTSTPTSTVSTQRPAATVTRTSTATTASSNTPSSNTKLVWSWPSKGPVINGFSTTGTENKGIDIAGKTGDDVLAAEAGEVVYAGSGLLRYGDLLIIKHNSQYLSAYAHNSKLLVSEGDKVTRGQKIAALGSTGIDREMLHFEIRNNGNPVDPSTFLPSR